MKYIILILGLIINFSYAQIVTIDRLSDAKEIEINKDKFIGKPLSYLLATIKVPIKSVIPTPNKNKEEINTLSFLFTDFKTYSKSLHQDSQKTKITVWFNQNWGLKGEKCTYYKEGCANWTQKDEKSLGDLIIFDIDISGKN